MELDGYHATCRIAMHDTLNLDDSEDCYHPHLTTIVDVAFGSM